MRFFIALEIPDQNKKEIYPVQQKISQLFPDIRLTDNEKLHLTIAFIGDRPDDIKEKLIESIKNSVIGIPPFAVLPSHIDGFPHLHTAHVLWIGVKGDETDKLFTLRHRIKDQLKKLELDVDERRYVPHIAIGKIQNFHLKEHQEKEIEKIMSSHTFSPIKVNSVKLYESIPNHGFHSHNTLAEIKLI